MRDTNQDHYLENLTNVFGTYNMAGMKVIEGQCDNKFRPLVNTIRNDFDIHMNYAIAGECIHSTGRRNNRVIEERIRAAFN